MILKRWNDAKVGFEEQTKLAFTTHVVTGASPLKKRVSLTATSNMPRLHNYFTGREDFVNQLHAIFLDGKWEPGSEPESCLVHGMGGMGKTQLALKYGFSHTADYDYRFWVRAETVESVKDSCNAILELLDIDKGSTLSVQAIKSWLENTGEPPF